MNATQEIRRCPVLVVDVAGSSAVPNFGIIRNHKTEELSARHLKEKRILRPYTVTAWDEFQSVVAEWRRVPEVLWEIRQSFAPLTVYIGVGLGEVGGWASERPMNEALSGRGFERARQAIDEAKENTGGKFRRLTRFCTGDTDRDALLNLIYALADTLILQVSDRQWEMMGAALAAQNQEEVARLFQVDPSTVTRNLKRGHYWQLKKTATVLGAQMDRGLLALKSTSS